MDTTVVRETIPPGWITKREAMRELNRSRVTFEKLAKDNQLEVQYLRRDNAQPELLYSRAAVKALRVVPVRTTPAPVRAPATGATSETPALVRLLAAAGAVTVADKHLLTMKEAHALGYPYDVLRRLRELPEPPGIRYGKRSFKFLTAELPRSIRLLTGS